MSEIVQPLVIMMARAVPFIEGERSAVLGVADRMKQAVAGARRHRREPAVCNGCDMRRIAGGGVGSRRRRGRLGWERPVRLGVRFGLLVGLGWYASLGRCVGYGDGRGA
ncbi:hypothetical protein ASF89_06535 [Frigoribacterium sp. Leaf172]|nr:hypothetical protein ASF89_06535 [Frigoribacterium sp. Leaf172]